MKFFDKKIKQVQDYLHAIKEIGPLKRRKQELEGILSHRIIKDRNTRQELREVRRKLEEMTTEAIHSELLKAANSHISIPIFYTTQDFVIIFDSPGSKQYFNKPLKGINYRHMFVDQEQFKEYSSRTGELYLGESFEMNVELKFPGKVCSKTTALPININKDKCYMIYLETIVPDPKEIEAKKESILEKIGSIIKKKPKPIPQN